MKQASDSNMSYQQRSDCQTTPREQARSMVKSGNKLGTGTPPAWLRKGQGAPGWA